MNTVTVVGGTMIKRDRVLASDIEKDLDALGVKEKKDMAIGYAYQWGNKQVTGKDLYDEYVKLHGSKPWFYRILDQRTVMFDR